MTPSKEERDRHYLARAGVLAEGGRGWTHPNPVVGCVIAAEDQILGEAFHARFGEAHAEVLALEEAGARARGATAYVTLEPCNHRGKTGPCTVALRDAGIRRVVYGAHDPGVGRGGADQLRQWGIDVVGPVLPLSVARTQNPAFFVNHEQGRAYVALKLAMSLDGRIAAESGVRTAITGPDAGARVHALRREFDGIMVGGQTARVDDPLLTVRDGSPVERPPARIALDSSLGLDPHSRLFLDPVPVHLFCGSAAPMDRREILERAGARVHPVATGPEGLDLDEVIGVLWQLGIRAILCEGGGRLGGALLRAHLVDRLYVFLSPVVLGEQGVPAFPDPSPWASAEGWTPVAGTETFGPDALVIWDRLEAFS